MTSAETTKTPCAKSTTTPVETTTTCEETNTTLPETTTVEETTPAETTTIVKTTTSPSESTILTNRKQFSVPGDTKAKIYFKYKLCGSTVFYPWPLLHPVFVNDKQKSVTDAELKLHRVPEIIFEVFQLM